MWKYKRQILVRYMSFLGGLLLLATVYLTAGDLQPDLTSKTSIKNCLTSLAVSAELFPWWAYPMFLGGTFLLMAAGVPSVIFFTVILIVKGFVPAYLITLFSQTIVSLATIHRSARRPPAQTASLTSKLADPSVTEGQFLFWSRIYYEFPLRTIDSLTPAIQAKGSSLARIAGLIAAAVAVRIAVPSFWVHSLIVMISSLDHDLAGDINRFLAWSTVLVVYTMLPRVPELFLCPGKLKDILYNIANGTTSGQQSRNGLNSDFSNGQIGTKPQLAK